MSRGDDIIFCLKRKKMVLGLLFRYKTACHAQICAPNLSANKGESVLKQRR
ncbi:hypothetical protein HAT2_00003 [Candidatus Similichlamydia laticola]|uniref:Uncharacterized protein n=1 Tax=Candidatus Similichlamydia laticola TaxID=2170265 RepID=A0A369KJC2_9BACT|nr:hypothetical protein HAT2_00003 [Candidatus Similichlamydia laticola]